MKSSGFEFNGQTEFIGNLSMKNSTIKKEEIMILTTTKPLDGGKNLIVGLVTTHIPLREIFKHLSRKLIEKNFRFFIIL